jgi:hypothetical protein
MTVVEREELNVTVEQWVDFDAAVVNDQRMNLRLYWIPEIEA